MAKSIEQYIFPDLALGGELKQKVRRVEKAWLDTAKLSMPVLFTQGAYFAALKGARAIPSGENKRLLPVQLTPAIAPALYAQGLPFYYLIECRNGKITILIGTFERGAQVLEGLLDANPGRPLYEHLESPSEIIKAGSFPCCCCLTGIPHSSEKPEKDGRLMLEPVGADQLITGMLRGEWLYAVHAQPITRELVSTKFDAYAREIEDIKKSFGLREIQKADRMAVHYVQQLEQMLKMLKIGLQQGFWQTCVSLFTTDESAAARASGLLASLYSGDKSVPEPIRCHTCTSAGTISPFINGYHSKDLETLAALPAREHQGYRLREQILFDVDFKSDAAAPLEIGTVQADGIQLNHVFSIPVSDLNRHALVAGVTGSGKTNTVFNLLLSLYDQHRIPFLVIEPAKSEYRELLRKIPSLSVFTLGEERPEVSSPFRINPFAFPNGISLQTHIDYLKAVFNASFVMYAPMPYVLEDCLYRIYEDKGWNLVTSINPRGEGGQSFPTLLDLYNKIDPVVDILGYESRTALDIKAALKTRINNLCVGGKGLMLNTPVSTPFHDIMQQPTVLELKSMGNEDEKVFMMGLVLTALYEYYEAGHAASQGLNHLTVIEEAHRLLKNVPTEKSSEDMANMKGKGVETFCNLLSEIRAYGEGILVAEQIPSKLAPDVIKNTSLKIMHRIVSKEDRDVMGDAMNLDAAQKRHVVGLARGEAAAFSEGLDRPLLISVTLSPLKDCGRKISDAEMHDAMHTGFFRRHPGLLQKFPACSTCPHNQKPDCLHVKRSVEQILSSQDIKLLGVKAFLPYVIDPERKEPMHYLRSIIDVDEDHLLCLAAHLVDSFMRRKGDFWALPYEAIDRSVAEAHKALPGDGFMRVLREYCKKEVNPRHDICRKLCPWQGLLCYEMSVLAEEPTVHNRLADLLLSPVQEIELYREIVLLAISLLQDYLPGDNPDFLKKLVICYIITKLRELGFSRSIQIEILRGSGELLQIGEALWEAAGSVK